MSIILSAATLLLVLGGAYYLRAQWLTHRRGVAEAPRRALDRVEAMLPAPSVESLQHRIVARVIDASLRTLTARVVPDHVVVTFAGSLEPTLRAHWSRIAAELAAETTAIAQREEYETVGTAYEYRLDATYSPRRFTLEVSFPDERARAREFDDYTAYAPETPRDSDDYTESAANSAVPQWFLVLPDGRSYVLEAGHDFTVGAASDCDVVFNTRHVSRNHLRLTVSADSLRIDDLASTNGTFVDGTRITSHTIRYDATLRLGPDADCELLYRLEQGPH
ncbi:FHA domain-containing protein [Nocardia lasii]|uniref:FHA domain-containing protein n=1 Tax=Nocardia lasii TaxID=1616107 RepID=A0ABW1JTC7_9NOCA